MKSFRSEKHLPNEIASELSSPIVRTVELCGIRRLLNEYSQYIFTEMFFTHTKYSFEETGLAEDCALLGSLCILYKIHCILCKWSVWFIVLRPALNKIQLIRTRKVSAHMIIHGMNFMRLSHWRLCNWSSASTGISSQRGSPFWERLVQIWTCQLSAPTQLVQLHRSHLSTNKLGPELVDDLEKIQIWQTEFDTVY